MDMILLRYVAQFVVIFVLITWNIDSKKRSAWQWILLTAVAVGYGVWFDSHGMNAPFHFYVLTIYMLLAYWWLLRMPFGKYLFYYSAGMLVQDAVYNLFMIFHNLIGLREGTWAGIAVYLAVFAVTYVLLCRFIRWWHDHRGEMMIQANVTALSVIIIVINQISQLFIVVESEYDWSNLQLRLYSILVCALALSIQFGLFRTNQLQKENEDICRLLVSERAHHAMTQETAEVISMKCHDLKQQIAAARRMSRAEEQERELRKVEEAIGFYDSILKTGNDALDAILGEKEMICEKTGIRLNYMGDGRILEVLRDTDLYSLVGNALDNAIEGIRDIGDREKRFIEMEVKRQAGLAVLHMENYCDTPLEFQDGLPQTTKGDRQYHGYGMKSMRYITAQYGGTLSVLQRNSRFILNIAIPIPET